MAKITEGYMPFHGYQTYYRIVGEQKDNGKAPLICLHGGPGSTHNYYEVLDNVADDDDRMIVMYDQLGCGKSYLDGHPEMWTQDLWLDDKNARFGYGNRSHRLNLGRRPIIIDGDFVKHCRICTARTDRRVFIFQHADRFFHLFVVMLQTFIHLLFPP